MNFDLISQNEHQIHTRLLQLLQHQLASHNVSQLSTDSWQIMQKLKVLTYQYMDNDPNTTDTEISLQLLYQHINENINHLTDHCLILNGGLFEVMGNFFEVVVMPVVGYYVKERGGLADAVLIRNRCGETSEGYSQCICENENPLIEYSITNNKFCYRCGEVYHNFCFNIKQNDVFECPFCFLQHCLPDRYVIDTLFKGYLPAATQSKPTTSIIQLQSPLCQYSTQKISLQLRCTRPCHYQICWPPSCDIYLDDVLSVSYKPLSENSSLKARHDNPIVIPLRDLISSEIIKIKEYFAGPGGVNGASCHAVGLYVVVERDERQIFESVLGEDYYVMKENQSKMYLQKLFWKSNHLQIDQVRISNKCQFYSSPIAHPCRSKQCTTHYQPFDLYNFICSSVKAKTSIKRWKCPICGVRAYDVVRDLYLERIMGVRVGVAEFGFGREGQVQEPFMLQQGQPHTFGQLQRGFKKESSAKI